MSNSARQKSGPHVLELTPSQMREAGRHALERAIHELSTQQERPVAPARLTPSSPLINSGVSTTGIPLPELIDAVFDRGLPGSFNAASPGYLAYVPGGGLFPASIADLVADLTNRYTGLRIAAPSLVDIEAEVLRWFALWLGMPASTRGLTTTGGSMATFSAVIAAREKHLGTELRRGTIYVSDQAHHCVAKAAKLAGILLDRVRVLPADAEQRLPVAALRAAVRADRQAGLLPFMVVSSAGTTNTGAIDPLQEIAELCHDEALWHHVDGAYGGFFVLCDKLRPRLQGIESADSVTLDPHKGLFLPYGTGALLVRDGNALRSAHQMGASYLPDAAEHYSPADYGPELTRDFRALRIWFCVQHFGLRAFEQALLEKHELAAYAARALHESPLFDVLNEPELSLFAFRMATTKKRRDQHTQALIDKVNARGRVMLSGTWLHNEYWARICVLCFRTHREHIDWALEDLHAAAEEITKGG